jgi:serine/threonine protein kinase
MNPEAASLIKSLLERNPSNRIGFKRGFEEIKEHPWCKDIDWQLVKDKKMTPPWKPRLDRSNFDPEYT